MPKKDIALQAIAYGYVYVARVAMGADPQQTLRAFREAEAYDGPSLVIAYSHCVAHGIEMRDGLGQQYRAVASGYWPLTRAGGAGPGGGRPALGHLRGDGHPQRTPVSRRCPEGPLMDLSTKDP
jgi:pyruvate-ferredoxin/flavodoxin oxidoreductase